MPLPALSLWPGRQPCRPRLVDDRIGGGPSSVVPRSLNPPTDLLITVFARPTPVRSRLRARQQSQSSPDPAGKDTATSSPTLTDDGTSVRLSFQSRSLLLLADESSGVTVTKTSELVSSLKSDRNLFSRMYCMLHLSFVIVTSMNFSLTRTNHVLHLCQIEGNSYWAPSRTLFEASKMP